MTDDGCISLFSPSSFFGVDSVGICFSFTLPRGIVRYGDDNEDDDGCMCACDDDNEDDDDDNKLLLLDIIPCIFIPVFPTFTLPLVLY